MDHLERAELIEYILKGNEMMRRHFAERQRLLKKIAEYIDHSEENKSELVNFAINEAASIRSHVNDLEMQLTDLTDNDAIIYRHLKNVNQVLTELDRKEAKKKELVEEIMQLDANLVARDELIDIIQEFINVESAQSHRLVVEISEMQDNILDAQNKLNTYEKLSKHDPRFIALKILGANVQGMSQTQLGFMLETSRYESNKIIRELIDMDLIKREGELIKITDNFESTFVISQGLENIIST